MKAWAAEGGENCDKRNVFDKRNVVVESMGCRGGRKFLIKGMFLIKEMYLKAWAAEGGKIAIKGMFLIKGM